MFRALNTKLLYSTAYHPQSDGQTERIISIAEIMTRFFIAVHPQEEWKEYLPAMQPILNCTRNASTGFTPHELMYSFIALRILDSKRQNIRNLPYERTPLRH